MKITVEEAARIMGKSPQTVRIGLQQGVFPFGTAFKLHNSNKYVYEIYPARFYELYGKGND